METVINFLLVLAIWAAACAFVVLLIVAICWLGSRGADEQLNPDNLINTGRRRTDYPTQRCAGQQEDGQCECNRQQQMREQFESGCG